MHDIGTPNFAALLLVSAAALPVELRMNWRGAAAAPTGHSRELAAGSATILLAVCILATPHAVYAVSSLPTAVLLCTGLAGVAGRWWSVRVLDRSFSPLLEMHSGQRLTMFGPYGWVRHPGYSAALLVFVSITGLAACPAAFGALALLVLGVLHRIGREDALLAASFPREFPSYCERVPALVPRLRPLGRKVTAIDEGGEK